MWTELCSQVAGCEIKAVTVVTFLTRTFETAYKESVSLGPVDGQIDRQSCQIRANTDKDRVRDVQYCPKDTVYVCKEGLGAGGMTGHVK